MKQKLYYIYEIPGVKIGCTTNPKYRVVDEQGFTEYKILETHTDIMVASYREIELQKEKGYKVDTSLYYKSKDNRRKWTIEDTRKSNEARDPEERKQTASSVGKENVRLNRGYFKLTKEDRSQIGKRSGKINGQANVKSGHWANLNKMVHDTKFICPDGHISNMLMYRKYCKNHGLDPALAVKIEKKHN